jgi:hypothetical protein
MIYRWLADTVALIHAAFVVFVLAGGILVMRWRRLVWAHVPAVVWGVLIEYVGWRCPLTPLENALRDRAGQAGYGGGFIEHYVLRAIYPAGLTRAIELVLGSVVVIVNVLAYRYLWKRGRRVATSAASAKRSRKTVDS